MTKYRELAHGSVYFRCRSDPVTNLEKLPVKSITNVLEQLATLTDEAQAIANCLEDLREELSDDQWEAIENSPLGDLINACIDMESTIDALNS